MVIKMISFIQFMPKFGIPALIAAGLVLPGCMNTEERVHNFSSLTCAQINQEIGKNTYRKEDAQVDSLLSDVDMVLSDDDDDRTESAVSGLVSGITESDADANLEALRKIKATKGCS